MNMFSGLKGEGLRNAKPEPVAALRRALRDDVASWRRADIRKESQDHRSLSSYAEWRKPS